MGVHVFAIFRLVLFSLVAFTLGVLHERGQVYDRCAMAGGRVTDAGICRER